MMKLETSIRDCAIRDAEKYLLNDGDYHGLTEEAKGLCRDNKLNREQTCRLLEVYKKTFNSHVDMLENELIDTVKYGRITKLEELKLNYYNHAKPK